MGDPVAGSGAHGAEAPGDAPAAAFGEIAEQYERLLAPRVFEPWAEVLVELAAVGPGQRILDVASGTGAVARAAARRAAPGGSVVATDASGPMLQAAAARAAEVEAAPIEHVEAPATELQATGGGFDVVLCQQGLQFMEDRPAAVAEMRRMLRAGGSVAVAVWAAGRPVYPFDPYIDALREHGVEPPFPRAFENERYKMSTDELGSLLEGAGFARVETSALELVLTWPDADEAAAGVHGTPFAPVIAGLSDERRDALMRDIRAAFADEPVRRVTTAVVARAAA